MPKFKMLYLGCGAYVDPEEVVAIDQHHEDNCYSIGQGWANVKAAVLLFNRCVVPAWYTPETLRRNLERIRSDQA